ncbi:beta-N-acetylglucosaminidase domain-containing protein [Nakamurella aerolata]|uniref:beta-N-acetylglucosaminidase domain-containing protein n=1 Tax=Nakamurella aerolata TaxID=1656892 RepID=UPI001BB1E36B
MRRIATATTTAVCLAASVLLALPAAAGSSQAAAPGQRAAAPSDQPLPVVSPTPQQIQRTGGDVVVPGRVGIVTGPETDADALAALRKELTARGVARIDVSSTRGNAPLNILLGAADRPDIAAALAGTNVPEHAEGYALRVTGRSGPLATVALGGVDASGQFYAVQTLRQLFTAGSPGRSRLAAASVSDYPAMPLRGVIEGFYGEPWTQQDRLDQMDFYGDIKANTYIYAPKDDPYHREKWREPYPADKLAELTDLVGAATKNKVAFTFALSPGNTVCYSSPDDLAAVTAKFEQMYSIGVRAFSIPLDDINLSSWHCTQDQQAYGAPNAGNAGKAQADFLNKVQREFIATHEGARPLQMVPTEYYNTTDTPYKQSLRALDPAVVVMWTGEGVVPKSVTVEQAQAAAKAFGRKPFLWDNYPVNDFGNTAGRLLLAPYAKREAGLSEYLAGIVSNPMNQAAASKIAVFGFADFTWNDTAYAVDRSWTQSMRYLSDGDAKATAALRVFADLNHMAPTFEAQPWQAQSPELAARIDAFWKTWDSGDRAGAIAALRPYAQQIADAPSTIRAGAVDPRFVAEAKPWLDATALWGKSLLQLLDAAQARLDGDQADSEKLAAASAESQRQASAVRVEPSRNTWGNAPVRIADGVLDSYLARLSLTLQLWEAGNVTNVALGGTATASSTETPSFPARNVNDGNPSTRWASGYDDASWVQVKLARPADVRAVTVSWEAACANAYKIQTSVDGSTWTDAATVNDSSCAFDVINLDSAEPVNYVRMQGVERKSKWGYSIYELGIYAPAP